MVTWFFHYKMYLPSMPLYELNFPTYPQCLYMIWISKPTNGFIKSLEFLFQIAYQDLLTDQQKDPLCKSSLDSDLKMKLKAKLGRVWKQKITYLNICIHALDTRTLSMRSEICCLMLKLEAHDLDTRSLSTRSERYCLMKKHEKKHSCSYWYFSLRLRRS